MTMRPPLRARLLLGLGLGAAGLTVALAAGPAAASGTVCEGVVVDQGSGGGGTSVQAANVAPGTTDLQALDAANHTFTQNDSGLVCGIDGYPANAVANCTNTSDGLFYYWSYWQGDPSSDTWTYANAGPGSTTVAAGQTYVQGWRYQNPGPSGPSAPKPSVSPAAAFAQACPGVTPVAAGGRAGSTGGGSSGNGGAGTASSAGATTATSAPVAAPTTVPAPAVTGAAPKTSGAGPGSAAASSAHGTTAAGSGAGPSSGSPTTLAAGSTTTVAPATHGTPTHEAAKALAASDVRGHGSGGDPALPIIIVVVLVALMGGAAWFRWRRRPVEE